MALQRATGVHDRMRIFSASVLKPSQKHSVLCGQLILSSFFSSFLLMFVVFFYRGPINSILMISCVVKQAGWQAPPGVMDVPVYRGLIASSLGLEEIRSELNASVPPLLDIASTPERTQSQAF
jgi:hypothetical protein